MASGALCAHACVGACVPACRRARVCARVCAPVRVRARVRVLACVCVCVCARVCAWACVNFYIAGSGAEKPGFVLIYLACEVCFGIPSDASHASDAHQQRDVFCLDIAVNRGLGYGARMKKFIVNAGKVADLGLKLKLCDFEEGKDYVFKRKHNGMKVLWNKDLIAKLVSGEPIEADTEEAVEADGMIPKQISVSSAENHIVESHEKVCQQIETEDYIRDATEMVEIELPESENSISNDETDTELTWIDAPKIKECENSISKVETSTKTVEISSKLVEIASEICFESKNSISRGKSESEYTARVKKLFPNQRFVLLESNVMVASGKFAGRLRPGNAVFVRNGTVIRG